MKPQPTTGSAPPPAPRVSIVVATFRRLERLQRCIQRTRSATRCPHEIIVVDGGSDDGTPEWLASQPDIRTQVEQERAGCCRAYNLGFRMAAGEFVMWLNDDAYPLDGAIDAAVAVLAGADAAPGVQDAAHLNEAPCDSDESHRGGSAGDIGLVAFYHNHNQPWNEVHGFDADGVRYGVLHVRGVPYANFGLLRRDLLAQLGYLDEGYYFCGWDPDLSLKVQREAGLQLVSTPAARVCHEEHVDERKSADAGETRTRDNARLFEKWKLPDKGCFDDPRPAYLRRLQGHGLL